jgi:hypothetical protein
MQEGAADEKKKAGRRVSDGGKPRREMTTVTVFVQYRMGMPRKQAVLAQREKQAHKRTINGTDE